MKNLIITLTLVLFSTSVFANCYYPSLEWENKPCLIQLEKEMGYAQQTRETGMILQKLTGDNLTSELLSHTAFFMLNFYHDTINY